MKNYIPIVLTVAAFSFGAPVGVAYAQGAAAQASDPDAAATAAYTAWKAQTDENAKFEAGKQIITQYPGSKAAEAVAYAYIFDAKTDEGTVSRKYGAAKAYYDAGVASGKEGAYVEYALGNLATLEKDPVKLIEYGRTYMQKYPQGKFVTYVKTATAAARYKMFDTAVKENRVDDAAKTAEEAFAAGENEFLFSYRFAYAGLTDEQAKGANSAWAGKVAPMADRSIRFIESGKVPEGAEAAKWEKDKKDALIAMYRAKGVDTFVRIAKGNPTAADAWQPAIDELLKAAAQSPKDAIVYYFLSSAYAGQYAAYSTQFSALPEDQKNGDAGKPLLEKVNASADKVIDSYIKLIAFAGESSQVATQTKPKLAELWAFRHPDAPNTWEDEIKKLAGGGTAAAPGK
jgi:hypothetical protein